MRLTLRTLLAWLEDTLPPIEVREIGRQVSESAYAQELVERIYRVTRQRRLTVPGTSGPEGTDPNIVASYVDNDLDAEQVGEYEKKCLSSDVNLAEAACVHQILSLLGQKVHVPVEAKTRMYQLVKGRESTPVARGDEVKPAVRAPVTEPIQPWVAPAPPARHWLERFGPVAGCLVLVALLSWSAYQSLTPPLALTPSSGVPQQPAAGAAPGAEGSAEPVATNLPAGNSQPVAAEAIAGTAAGDSKDATGAVKEAEPEATTGSAAASSKTADNSGKPKNEPGATPPARAVPAGSVGVVDQVDGLLLRFHAEKREWERIAEGTSLSTSDRLVCLEPFRARIVVARTPITLIGETQVVLTNKTAAETPAFELADGRALIEGSAPSGSLKIGFAGLTVTIDRPSHGSVGLERISLWHYGEPATQLSPLTIHALDGELSLALDGTKETLAGPGTLVADSGGRFQSGTKKDLPAWMTEAEPSLKDRKLGEQLLEQFSKDRPVLTDTVLATESDSPVTKKLAIFAVKALGDLSFLTPILSRAGDRSARQSTAAALRAYLSRGPLAGKQVRASLGEEFGDQTGQVVERLLIGYSPDEAARKETHQRLVELLSPRDQSLAVRELALDNLKNITGRDDQGYNPENPDEKGYNAWKSLLNKDEIKPAPKRKAAD
ncbi:MAG: hypothetical protein JO114_01705 [Planctomycetaceae bacterium]|nr:hypothetical protein [Planctomycetaceae bacterium]